MKVRFEEQFGMNFLLVLAKSTASTLPVNCSIHTQRNKGMAFGVVDMLKSWTRVKLGG